MMVGSEAQTIIEPGEHGLTWDSLAETAYDPDRPPVPATANTSDTLIGQRIDHFEIRALLGEGGMGSVYLAHDQSLDRPVAIKVLRSGLADDPALVERLKKEARAQARLQHPNVVNVYYIGTHGHSPYFAMEYVRGETLADRITREGAIAWHEALDYVIQTARALAEANQRGIVHRDVKPSNLLLSSVGSQNMGIAHIKVADFGLAAPPGNKDDNFGGSPYYASPEQLGGNPPDRRSDIYSLGVTFHELLTGDVPFDASSLGSIKKMHATAPRPAIPARRAPWRLRQLITEMMDPDPENRPWTYEELLGRLESLRFKEELSGGLAARAMASAVDVGAFLLIWRGLFGRFFASALTAAFATFALFTVYYLVGHLFFGQTLGKRLLGLRVQGTTRAISLWGLALRFGVSYWGPIAILAGARFGLSVAPGHLADPTSAIASTWQALILGPAALAQLPGLLAGPNLWVLFVWAASLTFGLFDEKRRGLHDLLARTRIVYSIRSPVPETR